MHIMDMWLSVSQKGAKMRQGRIYKMRYQIIKTYDVYVYAENEDKAVDCQIGDIDEVC